MWWTAATAPPDPLKSVAVLLQFPDMDALKACSARQAQIEADVGNEYASYRAIGMEGVEQK